MEGKDGEYNDGRIKNCLTLPGEKLLIAKRQHWFVIMVPLVISIILNFGLIAIVSFLFLIFLNSVELLIAASLLISSIFLTCITKLIVDWFNHVYVVTNRKILEVNYAPLFSDALSDLLLDQVRTIEVDIKKDNILNQLFDMGDIIISFDRPSKDKVFVLSNINKPRESGIFLGDQLESVMESSPAGFQNSKSDHPSKFTQDYVEEKYIDETKYRRV